MLEALTLWLVLAQAPSDPVRLELEPVLDAHRRCRTLLGMDERTATCARAQAGYQRFLERHADWSGIDEVRFFFAELLYDQLNDFTSAAELYQLVAEAPRPGRWAEQAARNRMFATQQLLRAKPLPQTWGQHLEACDRYVALYPDSPDAPRVATGAALLVTNYGSVSQAEQRLRQILTRWPDAESEVSTAAVELAALLAREHATHRLAAYARELLTGKWSPGVLVQVSQSLEAEADRLTETAQHAQAAELLTECARLRDDDGLALRAAHLYLQADERGHAVETLELSFGLEPGPTRSEALSLAAWLSAGLGRPRESLRFLHQAQEAGLDEAGREVVALEEREVEAMQTDEPGEEPGEQTGEETESTCVVTVEE